MQLKSIAFIGDSYCNAYDWDQYDRLGRPKYQHGAAKEEFTTHPTVVADYFNWRLIPLGFSSRSWWYSRYRLLDVIKHDAILDNCQVLVFFHTEYSRINIAHEKTESTVTSADPAVQSFYKNLYDDDFNRWAQQQWFKEINQVYGHLKTIHFNCFPTSVDYCNLLPGMVYTTPLVNISIGEITGTDAEILEAISTKETRKNHLNSANNQALADVIITAINNYEPGFYTIDTTKFEQPNTRAVNYPNPGYGTK